MTHTFEAATSRGVRELFLLTTGAAAYFEHHGFARTPRENAPRGHPQHGPVSHALSVDGDLHAQDFTPELTATMGAT